jgi:ABC-type Fe3+-hydroxamate transport system substrate-binding protein
MFSYGPKTIQGSCLEEAGLSNVLANYSGEMSPQLNFEFVLTLAPELIFYASDVPEPRGSRPSDLSGEPVLQQILQGGQSHIVLIPGAWMASISHYALAACDAYVKAAATMLRQGGSSGIGSSGGGS